jgi:hypothetical protein
VKHKVELIIFLLLGLTSLVYVFPSAFVDAAKLESGVTVNGTPTPETEKICDDQMDNNNDGKIDADDQDCAAAPAGPTAETFGLQIVSGVPINYGQLTMGQESVEKEVWIKNEGTSQMSAIIKGGDWVSDAAPNPTISGPERTFFSMSSIVLGAERRIALDDNNGFTLGPIYGGQQIPLYFTFRGFVNGPIGSFHQEVTIDIVC